jgi:hypothetical protein
MSLPYRSDWADTQSNKEALSGVKISGGKGEKCGFLGFRRGWKKIFIFLFEALDEQ